MLERGKSTMDEAIDVVDEVMTFGRGNLARLGAIRSPASSGQVRRTGPYDGVAYIDAPRCHRLCGDVRWMCGVPERFTVVAFDPRGYSRSTLDGGPEDRQVAVQSEDAYRLLAQLTDEPAYVFGTSAGAVVCLDLLARHPERVRTLVAHEPPCLAVLPDAAEHRAMIEEVYTLFHAEGVGAAAIRFLTAMGGEMKPPPDMSDLPPRTVELRARMAANAPIMFEHELRNFTAYRPGGAALAQVADRLMPAVGRDSLDTLPYRATAELSAQLGRAVAEFPGAHNGIRTDAAEFAAALVEILISAGDAIPAVGGEVQPTTVLLRQESLPL
ncbi:alpha/beta hydrolase [Nocardia xishanensis]|uniref:alpha/beta hydrolase n=1 Tax=Nocardia xishanensis TaxID=238964 RepID=UPI003442B79A